MAKPDLSEFFRVKKCVIGELSLSKEQWEKLNNAMSMPNKDVPTTVVMEVLETWGFPVKRTALVQHRRSQCCCAK